MARIDASMFEVLGRHFAARSAEHHVSWAWVDSQQRGPFAQHPSGFLHTCMLVEQKAPSEDIFIDVNAELAFTADVEEDDSTLSAVDHPCASRIELHIVHSTTFGVPVLLLQGYSEHGNVWNSYDWQTYLASRKFHVAQQIPTEAISQMEHPSLGVPFFCLHPCRTAEWMSHLLLLNVNQDIVRTDGQLDYLSVWWSALAPVVGTSLSAAEARALVVQGCSASDRTCCDPDCTMVP